MTNFAALEAYVVNYACNNSSKKAKNEVIGRQMELLRAMTDLEALDRLGRSASSRDVQTCAQERRAALVGEMTDQGRLLAIAQKDKEAAVAVAATERLTDPGDLFQVAQQRAFGKQALIAVERLDDQEVLQTLAETNANGDVRVAALNKLTDPAGLRHIADTDESPSVRIAAVYRLHSPDTLLDIAQTNTDASVRAAAVQRITDPGVLREIAEKNDCYPAREAAIVCLSHQSSIGSAIRALTDTAYLLDILHNRDKASHEHRLALERLLALLAAGEGDESCRDQVCEVALQRVLDGVNRSAFDLSLQNLLVGVLEVKPELVTCRGQVLPFLQEYRLHTDQHYDAGRYCDDCFADAHEDSYRDYKQYALALTPYFDRAETRAQER